MTLPILVFAWGNPSRGDDALGPLFAERIEALQLPGVECLTDFQLQVEHALDLRGRERILFVDASADIEEQCRMTPVQARRDASFTSHAMSPQAVLQAYVDIEGELPPSAMLLEIRGDGFELGAELSASAAAHLEQAIAKAVEWIGASKTGACGGSDRVRSR